MFQVTNLYVKKYAESISNRLRAARKVDIVRLALGDFRMSYHARIHTSQTSACTTSTVRVVAPRWREAKPPQARPWRPGAVFVEEFVQGACEIDGFLHLQGRASGRGASRSLREVEHVRPDQHRQSPRRTLTS